MIAEAIAAQSRYASLPETAEPIADPWARRKAMMPDNAKLSAVYTSKMPEWASWARITPRTITELRDKMQELTGLRPSDTTTSKWATDRGIVTVGVRKKVGLAGEIRKELLRRKMAGATGKQLAVWVGETYGIEVNDRQIMSAVHGAKRLKGGCDATSSHS